MGYIKGITIEIDGETKGLDAALKKVNRTAKGLEGELKRVESLLRMNPGNADLIRQKQKLLAQSVSETKTKLDALRQAQKKLDSEGLDETNADYRRIQREIVETTSKLKLLEREQAKFNVLASGVGRVAAKMSALGSKISAAGQKMRTFTMAATLATAAAVSVGKEFDESMSKVRAVSGATGEDFDKLRAKAREMGAKTKFSASEAAEAMNYMAMAGWKTNQMLSGIEGIMSLAAASGEDLATTSDIVTDALTAMGYAAKDSGHLADVMAAASSNANTNVAMMGETFKYAAAVAGSMGYSMEDVAFATSLMANSGIKATQAGTSLRSIISRMAAPTGAVQKTMDQLGVSMTDSSGKARPFRDVLVDLRKSMAGMSETEKTAAASTLAGKNAMSGFLALINASDKDFDKLASAIDNSAGAAEKMADTMLDNFGGQVTVLMSSLQELAIAVSDTLTPAVKVMVSVVQKLVSWFNSLSDRQKSLVVGLAAVAAAIGPLFIAIGGMLGILMKCVSIYAEFAGAMVGLKGKAGVLSKGLGVLTGKFKAVAAASRAEQAVIKTNTALYGANAAGIYKTTVATGKGTLATRIYTKAQMALNRVLALGPWKLVAIGIGLVIAAFAIFCAANDDAREKIINTFKSISSKAVKVLSKIPEIFKGIAAGISKALPKMAKAASKAIPKIAKALSKSMPQMLDAGVETVLTIIDGITKSLPELIATGTDILISLISSFTENIGKFTKAGVDIMTGFLTGIVRALPKVASKIPQVLTAILTALTANAGKIAQAGAAIIAALVVGLIKCIPVLIKAVPQIIAALVKAIVATGVALVTSGAKLIAYLLKGIKSNFAKVLTAVANFIKSIPAKIKNYLGQMKSAGGALISNFLSGLKGKFSGVLSSVSSFARSIPKKVKSGLGSLKSIGSNLITGLWNGIGNKVGWLKSKISGFVGNVKAWLKKFFKIGSPSKLMADEIGQWIPAGIAAGITGNMDSLKGAMKGMTDTIESPSFAMETGGGAGIDYDRLADALVRSLSGVNMTTAVNLDGKTVARTTAPFMEAELNSITKRSNRKQGYR